MCGNRSQTAPWGLFWRKHLHFWDGPNMTLFFISCGQDKAWTLQSTDKSFVSVLAMWWLQIPFKLLRFLFLICKMGFFRRIKADNIHKYMADAGSAWSVWPAGGEWCVFCSTPPQFRDRQSIAGSWLHCVNNIQTFGFPGPEELGTRITAWRTEDTCDVIYPLGTTIPIISTLGSDKMKS